MLQLAILFTDVIHLFYYTLRWISRSWTTRLKKIKYLYSSHVFYSHTKSILSKELKEARLPTIAEAEEQDEFYSFDISQTSALAKFSPGLPFSKIHLQKDLFEEYKLIASEILHELGEILQKYAEYNIIYPAGIVNLMNYSWHDLIEGASKCATKSSVLKKSTALERDPNAMTQISSFSRDEYHKENHLLKAKKARHVSSGK